MERRVHVASEERHDIVQAYLRERSTYRVALQFKRAQATIYRICFSAGVITDVRESNRGPRVPDGLQRKRLKSAKAQVPFRVPCTGSASGFIRPLPFGRLTAGR